MDLNKREDIRKMGIWVGRIRAAIGLVYLLAPDYATSTTYGGSKGSASRRVMTRFFGAREFTIGLGTAIACAEGERGSDWLGIGAMTDAADTALVLFQPGLPLRGRLVAFLTIPAAIGNYFLARKTHEVVEPVRAVESQ